jgi:hypothetical protein
MLLFLLLRSIDFLSTPLSLTHTHSANPVAKATAAPKAMKKASDKAPPNENVAPVSSNTASAVKKAPVKVMTEKDSATLVTKYINDSNKPINASCLCENLHKAIPLTALKRILDSLSSSGKIKVKEFGKTSIYYPDQGQYPDVSMEDVAAMDEAIVQLKTESAELIEERKKMEGSVSKISSTLSIEELRLKLATLKDENVRGSPILYFVVALLLYNNG